MFCCRSLIKWRRTGEEKYEMGNRNNKMTDENNVKGEENQKGHKGKEEEIQEKAT